MKALALLLLTAPLLGAGLATLFVLFLLTFPWENTEPVSDTYVVAAVGVVGLGLLVPAGLAWIGVAMDRMWLATRSFAAHAIAALVLLLYAVSESSHSDGTWILFALSIEIPGALGLWIATRNMQPSRVDDSHPAG